MQSPAMEMERPPPEVMRIAQRLFSLLKRVPSKASVMNRKTSLPPVSTPTRETVDKAVKEALDKSVKGENYLCTTLCDLLFGLPEPPCKSYRNHKVITALRRCYSYDNPLKDIYYLDLREHSADFAKRLLIDNLRWWDGPPWDLGVIVGCKEHGVGEGKLQQAVVSLLSLEQGIDWNLDGNGSLITIRLCGNKYPRLSEIDDRYSISVLSNDGSVALSCEDGDIFSNVAAWNGGDGEDKVLSKALCAGTATDFSEENVTNMNGNMNGNLKDASDFTDDAEYLANKDLVAEDVREKYKERPLCTVICDLLPGLRRLTDQPLNENVTNRVISGLEMCYKDYSDKHKESRHIIDLRGCCVEDAFERLIQRLSGLVTETGFLYVRVGCEMHGIGEGKLKKAIIALLKETKIKFDENYSDSLVSITLDGRESYSFHGDVHVYDELFNNDDDFLLLSDSVSEDDGGLDYVVTCDLKFNATYQSQDVQSSERVVEDLDKCDDTDGYKMEYSSCNVQICSRSADEVIWSLANYLDGWFNLSSQGCKDRINGCRVHCSDKREAELVLGMLKDRKGIRVKEVEGYICITFDGSAQRL